MIPISKPRPASSAGGRIDSEASRRWLAWQRLPDLLCWPFAGWTVLCHLTVLLGGGLRSLVWCTAVVGAGGIVLWALQARRGQSWQLGEPPPPLPPGPSSTRIVNGFWHRWSGRTAGAAVLVAGVLALTSASWLWCWWLAIVFLTLTVVREELLTAAASPRHPPPPPRPTRRQDAVVWLLVVLAIVTALCIQQPDLDDSFYLNLSVTAADLPDQPLLCCDSLHGLPEEEISLPSQRLRALELLSGALAWLTGVAPIYWNHFLFPILGALLLVTAYGRLLLRLVGERWLACLATILVILAATGGPYAWYGNLAFSRLHQGKAIFASALVPLLLAYAIELARAPSRRRWLTLVMANIAAIGLTPSALWVAPAVSAVGLLGALPYRRRSLKILGLGLLATTYAWAAGLSLRLQMGDLLDASVANLDSTTLLERSTFYVLGQDDLRLAGLATVLFCWWFCRPGPLRRFCLTTALVFAAVFFNPYLAKWLAGTGTSAFTYWRIFWILPLPLLLALVLTAPLGWWGQGWPSRRRWQATLVVSASFLFLVPRLIWDQERTRIALPDLRVPSAYSFAEEMASVSPPGSQVLAPYAVSAWLPTFSRHPYPLVTRPIYLPGIFEPAERRQRKRLTELVTRPAQDGKVRTLLFEKAITKYQLQAIAIHSDLPYRRRLEKIMEQHDFVVFRNGSVVDLWLRRAQADKIRQEILASRRPSD